MQTVLFYVLEYFFYSAAGWALESTYRSIGEKRLINSGFLTGPMCPIYGAATTVMTVCLYDNFRDNPLLVFLLGMLLCDAVELFTSVLMEKLFHARWWDYTYEFMNFQGRICLKHTMYWGVASLGFVLVIHPHVDKLLRRIPGDYLIYIVGAILVVFLLDVGNSVRKASDLRKLQDKLKYLTETLSGTLSTFKTAITDSYAGLQQSMETRSDKINDFFTNGLEQVQDLLTQFELGGATKSDAVKERRTKKPGGSRFLRNNTFIGKTTGKRIEKLKELRDEVKAILLENDEMQ